MTPTTQPANRFQEQFGTPKGRAATKVVDYMTSYVQEFIRQSPFVVMATSDQDGHCDTSPKGGKPGFVRVLDDRHLLLPDVAGNKLFQSYGNMDNNPHVGLLFMIPGVDDTVRVNGTVSIMDKEVWIKKNSNVAKSRCPCTIPTTMPDSRRSQDDATQREDYSGKKRPYAEEYGDVDAGQVGRVLLGRTFSGHNHDYGMFKQERPPDLDWFRDLEVWVDLGSQG
ncbi:hypothetical protein C2W62_02260, partial [Candidatus Entotheonella serta]